MENFTGWKEIALNKEWTELNFCCGRLCSVTPLETKPSVKQTNNTTIIWVTKILLLLTEIIVVNFITNGEWLRFVKLVAEDFRRFWHQETVEFCKAHAMKTHFHIQHPECEPFLSIPGLNKKFLKSLFQRQKNHTIEKAILLLPLVYIQGRAYCWVREYV